MKTKNTTTSLTIGSRSAIIVKYMKDTATQVLKKKGIIVYPTDTLYGILGRALERETVERIYKVKGRTPTKPFIILIHSMIELKKFGVVFSPREKKFLSTLWPGPVSVVLPCIHTQMQQKLKYLHRGTKSFAFRIPKNKKLLTLLKQTGPLVAPSANPEGLAPAENMKEAQKYFGTRIDLYVAGGRKKSKPSTLVSLVTGKPEVLRQGKKKSSITSF